MLRQIGNVCVCRKALKTEHFIAFSQKPEKKKKTHSSSTVFDCGQNNPGIYESHLTQHANMLGLCKVGLVPFEH